jgi:hypothetical protein
MLIPAHRTKKDHPSAPHCAALRLFRDHDRIHHHGRSCCKPAEVNTTGHGLPSVVSTVPVRTVDPWLLLQINELAHYSAYCVIYPQRHAGTSRYLANLRLRSKRIRMAPNSQATSSRRQYGASHGSRCAIAKTWRAIVKAGWHQDAAVVHVADACMHCGSPVTAIHHTGIPICRDVLHHNLPGARGHKPGVRCDWSLPGNAAQTRKPESPMSLRGPSSLNPPV